MKVEPLPENAYVKTVEIDGTAAPGEMAELSKTIRGARAKVTIGAQRGADFGPRAGCQGEPLPSNVAMVFLVPSAEDLPMEGNGIAQTTPEGKYTIKAFAPGKYRLFAMDPLQRMGIAGDQQDVFKKMFERAEEIELKEGERITKDMKVMAREDPDATPKK